MNADRSRIVHTLPVDDLIEHDMTFDECVCGPDVEIIQFAWFPDAYQIIHHSLDGRELRE